MLGRIGITFLIILLVGCYRNPEEEKPAATSSFTRAEIIKYANQWVTVDSNNRLLGVPIDSGSMLPTMDSKCILILEKVTDETLLNVNDICAYKKENGNFVLHRIRKIDGDLIIFRGDNRITDDNRDVKRSDVLWRVVGIFYTNGK